MSELLIDGQWRSGAGDLLVSSDPATGEAVWSGETASPADCATAVEAARVAGQDWADRPLEDRIEVLRRFASVLASRRPQLAELLSRETGKLFWETDAEIGSMIGKVEVSITALGDRAGTRQASTGFGQAVLRHRPHGVMAVLGPYNFPGHLPNGHIVPALLAGNAVVFKPSEKAPAVGRAMVEAWIEAGLPDGVLNLLQGGRETGAALIAQDIDGLLFTGSAAAGQVFRRAFIDRPEVILALELGGNNPLVAWDGDPEAIASIIVQSAFVTTGQRCSCARRLIVPQGRPGELIVEALASLASRIRVAAWNEGEGFMGPLIDDAAAAAGQEAVGALEAAGAVPVLEFGGVAGRRPAFVRPGIYDVTGLDLPDGEVFAPVLQVIRAGSFDAAIAAANATRFGLSAGLVSADSALWHQFTRRIRAGVVNWNRPTTGAASNMPFGGLGCSGNHRPSAYYAADYCAYPVASFEASTVEPVEVPGLTG